MIQPHIEKRANYLDIEERLSKQDAILIELKSIIENHIRDEKELTPVIKELVKTWEAAHWLINLVKWVGIIAGAFIAFIALLKGTKP